MNRTSTSRSFRPAADSLERRDLLSVLPPGYVEGRFATGLDRPTALALLPDGRILVSEQAGQLRVVQGGKLLPTPALRLSVDPAGERGLLGIAVDPRFSANHYIYLYYTVPGAHNRVSRFTLSGNLAVRGSERVLLELTALGATNHNGGSLVFGSDGKLYIGVGDNAVRANAQSLDTPLGKVLRINPDGTIPAGNPFASVKRGISRAIWAFGLRNPFNLATDPSTGRLYINDVGQDTFEKVDPGVAGGNYGWAVTENSTGDRRFVQPVYVYTHGPNDSNGCAITGGAFDSRNAPLLRRGTYFFADLCGNYVKSVDPTTGQATLFAKNVPTFPVGLSVNQAGALFVLSRGTTSSAGSITVIVRASVPRGPRG